MRVLVTGATGFIGNYVIAELLKRDDVTVVATGRQQHKAEGAAWYPKVRFVAFDMDDSGIDNLAAHFHYPDKVIHLAWSGLPHYKQLAHFENELPRQYTFLKKLIAGGVQDVTITGTCFEYGMQEGILEETMTTVPGNPYAFAKDTLRKELEFLQKQLSFQLKWVRLFYMFGAGQSQSSILSQLQKALHENASVFHMSQGDQLRDYLPVEQVASNLVAIALQHETIGIINNSSGTPISIKQLVDDYLLRTNSSIPLHLGYYPYPDYEPFAFWGNNSKLKKIINQ